MYDIFPFTFSVDADEILLKRVKKMNNLGVFAKDPALDCSKPPHFLQNARSGLLRNPSRRRVTPVTAPLKSMSHTEAVLMAVSCVRV
jgi:hypothetical protein